MTKILMSKENPKGHKLEELLVDVRTDLEQKCANVQHDGSEVAQAVLRNNRQIIARLRECEDLQRSTLATLDTIRPDEGPTGKPRVGAGS